MPLQKISSVVTDGAPAMIGRIRGVVTLLRNSGEFPNKFMSYHCVIHQEALCAKVATIDDVMTAVVKTINHIRSNALKRRQFRVLMEQNEDEHGDLLLHSEVYRQKINNLPLQYINVCLFFKNKCLSIFCRLGGYQEEIFLTDFGSVCQVHCSSW